MTGSASDILLGGLVALDAAPVAPKAPLPTAKDFFYSTSLYSEYKFDHSDVKDVISFHNGAFQFDGYCSNCKDGSVFHGVRPAHEIKPGASIAFSVQNVYFDVSAKCARCTYEYKLELLKVGSKIQKIGQFPSMEDIGSADIVRFRKLLKGDDFAELRRATGLFSHGIGIGSFVYLRRIFERIIQNHWMEANKAGDKLDPLEGKRMDEKIKMLSRYLPPVLVKNAAIYGILSKGIHELDEAACRTYFPVVKAAIVAILEQDLRAKEEAEAAAALEKDIARIAGDLKG